MNRLLILIVNLGLTAFISQASAETEVELGTRLYHERKWAEAAQVLHQFAETHPEQNEDYFAAEYYLGLSLFDLKLYVAGSNPMIKVVRSTSKKYRKEALEKLISMSGHLKNQKLLEFAISDLRVGDLKTMSNDVFEFKMAELYYDNAQYDQAINYLKQALQRAPDQEAELNLLALSYLKKNNTSLAIEVYLQLLYIYNKRNESDDLKVDFTTLNLARAYFQQKEYSKAVEIYNRLPKKGEAYRQSLKELAWSYLFMGQMAKAIGVLETTHTPYYENYFEPESLFLRAILLNGMCQFEEAEAAIQVFDESYVSLINILHTWSARRVDGKESISEIEFTLEALKDERHGQFKDKKQKISYGGHIPFKVTRTLLLDYRLANSYETILQIKSERISALKIFSHEEKQISFKAFLESIYVVQLNDFENQVAVTLSNLLMKVQKDLNFYKDQLAFVSYEITETRKKELKQKVIDTNLESLGVASENKVVISKKKKKSGYQVWAFDSEFWKDELNTYEYSGKNKCTADETGAGAGVKSGK